MTIETPTRVDDPAEMPDPRRIVGFDFVDPHTLVIEDNVRSDTGDVSDLDEAFLASIAEHGVRQPIIVRRRASDEKLVVRLGKGRTRVARHVGRWVDVAIERDPAPETDEVRAEQIERIVAQLDENQRRAAITDADEVRAHGQLMLTWGLSADEIAAATHSAPERVRRTTTVAASHTAMDMLTQLNLSHLEVIAELDGDDTAVAELVNVALNNPAQFPHVAQRLRQARQLADARAGKARELIDAGAIVVDPSEHEAAMLLYKLRARPEDPQHGPAITDEEHAGCPGHALSVDAFRHGIRDTIEVDVLTWCLDPAVHGHVPVWAPSTTITPDPPAEDHHDAHPSSDGPSPAGAYAEDLDHAAPGGGRDDGADSPVVDDAAERAAAERARRHAEAVDRYEVALTRNRTEAARAAETVRRNWLAGLLNRKGAPKGAALYIAEHLVRWQVDYDDAAADGHDLACELLGMQAPELSESDDGLVSQDLLSATRSASAARATVLTLALVLAAQERALTHQTWRHHTHAAAPYLRGLRTWGYPLSPIEELMLDPDSEVVIDGDPTPPSDPDGDDPAVDESDADRV
jgi:ParB family transcriptional regulator, chromosome partitioning protein